MGHNMSMDPDVLDWLLSRTGAAAVGPTLCVRHPRPGAERPPPPGCEAAASNTALDRIAERDQRRVLDELVPA